MKHITTIIMLCLLALATGLQAAVKETEVPYWVLTGILSVETKSSYSREGGTEHIVYRDQRVGAAGELSAFQITVQAWQQVRHHGDHFQDLATDQVYAERVAMDYLLWLYNGSAKRSWPLAVQMYHRGPGHRSYSYYANVAQRAKKEGYPQ